MRGDARHWLRYLESFSGEFPADTPRGGKEPSPNDPFPEADVAVILENRFVIAPMFAPPTKSSSEIVLHRLRKHPIINTSGKRIEVEESRNWAGPQTRRGMEYVYVYKKESNWLVSLGSAGSPI